MTFVVVVVAAAAAAAAAVVPTYEISNNPDFLLISHFISETIQDRAIVTVERQ